MATGTGAEVVWLPAASRATAVKVYDPFATLSVNAKTEYGCAGTSPPRLMTPFTLNWTPTTPTSSEAVAARVITPHMVAPDTGETISTVGGVVSVWAWAAKGTLRRNADAATRAPRAATLPISRCRTFWMALAWCCWLEPF